MSAALVAIGPDATAAAAARLMREHGVSWVPVLADGRLMGVLGRSDETLVAALDGQVAPGDHDTDAGSAHGGQQQFGQVLERRRGLDLDQDPGAPVAEESRARAGGHSSP